MQIVLPLHNINKHNIYFSNRQINTVMDKCFFSNIYYSTCYFTLHNIIIPITLYVTKIEKINNGVYYLHFCETRSKNIYKIYELEKMILKLYRNSKSEHINIKQNILLSSQKKVIRISEMKSNIVGEHEIFLRISGIWQDVKNNVGLIYKFML